MSRHPLEVSFNATTGETSPVVVRTDTELDELLTRLLERRHPNPPSIVLPDRPLTGPHDLPDHIVKIDMDRRAGIGAILFAGPRDMLPPDTPDLVGLGPDGGVWVTRTTDAPAPDDAPPLYIDKATLTEFPRDAALSLDRWRQALHELATTGLRPAGLDWQPSEHY